MPEEMDAYYCLGSLRVFEAKRIVARLEEAKIRFELEDVAADTDQLLAGMPGFGFGTFSDGPMTRVYIHRDDEKKFRKISSEFFKV